MVIFVNLHTLTQTLSWMHTHKKTERQNTCTHTHTHVQWYFQYFLLFLTFNTFTHMYNDISSTFCCFLHLTLAHVQLYFQYFLLFLTFCTKCFFFTAFQHFSELRNLRSFSLKQVNEFFLISLWIDLKMGCIQRIHMHKHTATRKQALFFLHVRVGVCACAWVCVRSCMHACVVTWGLACVYLWVSCFSVC